VSFTNTEHEELKKWSIVDARILKKYKAKIQREKEVKIGTLYLYNESTISALLEPNCDVC